MKRPKARGNERSPPRRTFRPAGTSGQRSRLLGTVRAAKADLRMTNRGTAQAVDGVPRSFCASPARSFCPDGRRPALHTRRQKPLAQARKPQDLCWAWPAQYCNLCPTRSFCERAAATNTAKIRESSSSSLSCQATNGSGLTQGNLSAGLPSSVWIGACLFKGTSRQAAARAYGTETDRLTRCVLPGIPGHFRRLGEPLQLRKGGGFPRFVEPVVEDFRVFQLVVPRDEP